MEEVEIKRSTYITSCEQLLTISCILAGFAFSGLVALPGIEKTLYQKIIHYFRGDFNLSFLFSFYTLFFSSLCFLCTILIVLVYKAGGYLIPIKKIKMVHFVSNVVFSLAIATLTMSVIMFGIPNTLGFYISIICGVGVSACFIWENMIPWQKKIRIKQIENEKAT